MRDIQLTPGETEQKKSKNYKVYINVAGEVYETFASTLDRYPETLLGTEEKRTSLLDSSKNQIYFDRHRLSFENILFYYQSNGTLARPKEIPMVDFETECMYYQLPENAIRGMKDRERFLHKIHRVLPPVEVYSKFKYQCYIFIDFPLLYRNVGSLAYFIFSFSLILISIMIYCVDSEFILTRHSGHRSSLTIGHYMEVTLHVYFAFEFLFRLYVHPFRKEFMKKPINTVEFITIFFYLILFPCPKHVIRNTLLNIVRIMRTIRLIRLSRISRPLKVAASVFQVSIEDVLAVIFVTLIVCILCGSIMYTIEMNEPNTKFISIPDSMWWAMQTVLCLGYGDIVPTSIFGKAVGSIVLFFGVVTVTVLILSLGGRFFDIYSKEIYSKDFLPESQKQDYEIHYK